MNYLSVCSGIEAATCAWHTLGWEPFAFSEIEPFPCAVLKHHHPEVPNFGDMTQYKEWPDATLDLLVGGTPCQSFSVAGLRKGLDDPRGNLMLTYGAIAAKYRPRWLVWENVPGVLSSNGGRDFGTFLGMLGQLGYGFAYVVRDAQYFGVAQRRRRVFVVGHLGDWRRAAAVLFERHSLSGHPSPRRGAGQGIAGTVTARTGGGGGLGTDFECAGGLVSQPYAVANCLTRRMHKGINTTLDEGQTPVISIAIRGREGGGAIEMGDECAHALRASQGGGDKPHVLAFHGAQDPNISGDVSHPVGRNQGQEVCAMVGMRVRRLTPTECERLQGFPDGHTAIPWRNKPAGCCPDGPRYKALGNSMAVPCMAWIGRRIAAVDSIKRDEVAA